MKVFSVATHRQRPQLALLGASIAEHAAGWEFEGLVLGEEIARRLDVAPEPLLARHGIELTTWWLAALLVGEEASAGRPALHLPPGAWLLRDPQRLMERLDTGRLVVGPRCLAHPGSAAGEPTAERLTNIGRLDPSVLGVDGSPESLDRLGAWRRRMASAMNHSAHQSQRLSPQRRRWLNAGLELARLRGEASVLGPALNLSGWNAWSVAFAAGDDQEIRVDGEPLTVLNLTDYDPGRPFELSAHSSRLRLSQQPQLAALVARYASGLLAGGWTGSDQRELIGATLPDGTRFDRPLWRQLRLAADLGERFGDIATEPGDEAFNRWLEQPAPGNTMPGISRYVAYRLLDERPDVADAFGRLEGANAAFVRWCHEYGAGELPIPERFLPPDPDRAATPEVDPSATDMPRHPPTVRFSGYLAHLLGLGAAARSYSDALVGAGIEVTAVSVEPTQPDSPDQLAAGYGRLVVSQSEPQPGSPPDVDVIAVNVDGLAAFAQRLGAGYFTGRRIGLWAWEADPLPPAWLPAFSHVDEVWAMSEYSAGVLARDAPVPVLAMAPPVSEPSLTQPPHRLGLRDGFLFLFIFDYFSTLQRKNPLGLIEAFSRAFTPGEGPQLLIKTLNGPRAPELEEAVRFAAAGHDDIHVIDASLSGPEKNALIAGCDCYVSLHRSEGFGLTMAEAMALGKPVIATGYSGNVDFMHPDNSFLVSYTLTHVGPDGGIYPAEARWAEPDLVHASALMRAVHEDRSTAALIAGRGRETVLSTLSPAVRGADMRRRLEQLSREPAHR